MMRPERGTWSERPAGRWEDAMVSGNGRMGVMVFGDPAEETIVANHCRLFLPLGSREVLPDLAEYLPELRRIARSEDFATGENTRTIELSANTPATVELDRG